MVVFGAFLRCFLEGAVLLLGVFGCVGLGAVLCLFRAVFHWFGMVFADIMLDC